MRDDVGAATAGIGLDGLAVREGDNRQQQRNGGGDGEAVVQGARARKEQDEEDLFGRIRRRREHVRRKDRERLGFRQALVDQLRCGERAAEYDALDRLDCALDASARPAAHLSGRDVTGSD